MSIPREGRNRKYSGRPPHCISCGLAAWWNGTRVVSAVRQCAAGVEHVSEIIRRRARCPSKQCPQGSWTIYEEEAYPHRVFDLAVVVSAVSAVVFAGRTLTGSAATHQCSRDSVRRWKRWVEQLAEPAELLRACTELEPDGMAGALAPSAMERAAAVLHLLDPWFETASPLLSPGATIPTDRRSRGSETLRPMLRPNRAFGPTAPADNEREQSAVKERGR
jgi:hypothetical protein